MELYKKMVLYAVLMMPGCYKQDQDAPKKEQIIIYEQKPVIETKKIENIETALEKYNLSNTKELMELIIISQRKHFESIHTNSVLMSNSYPPFVINCELCEGYSKARQTYIDERIEQIKKAKNEFSQDDENYKKLETLEKLLTGYKDKLYQIK